MQSSKICAIGDFETVSIFRSLGIQVFLIEEFGEAATVFDQVVREGYHVVFLTEKIAEQIPDALDKINLNWTPMVVLIPDYHGSTGYAFERVREVVKKAIGADIFKETEEE